VAGIDLIRRLERVADGEGGTVGAETFGVTCPLVTKADGGKIGKTETGAVWLTAGRTSPYRFHQFWLNTTDADVLNFLRWYTFVGREEIEALDVATAERPQERAAQKRLADEVTRMMHGQSEVDAAIRAAQALFSGEVRGLDAATLGAIADDLGAVARSRDELATAEPPTVGTMLKDLGLASSNREVREFIGGGAVRVNGEPVTEDRAMTAEDILDGGYTLIRRGRKNWAAVAWG
jgi:tyrosyl-tRNA synthetase